MLQCQLIKKSSIIDCVLPEKNSYWAVRMLNKSITPPLLPGYNMDVLSKFLPFICLLCFITLIVYLVKFYLCQKKTFKQ